MTITHYRLYGLTLASEILLPELAPLTGSGEADVTLRVGPVEAPSRPDFVDSDRLGLRFEIDGVGRFEARDGRELRVQPAPGAEGEPVRLYLLGSGMAAILAQRGRFALHASALSFGGAAVAFVGPSGAGKSTLAAWMAGQGAKLLSDDVCAIVADQGGMPLALPGLSRFRLFQDSLEANGLEGAATAEVDLGEGWRKFIVPAVGPGGPVPLRAVYLLDGETGETGEVERMSGAEAAAALHANCYRGEFLALAGSPQRHFEDLMRIASQVPVFRFGRSRSLDGMDSANRRLLDHLKVQSKV